MRGKLWSKEEDDFLRRIYSEGGFRVFSRRFPDRTFQAYASRVNKILHMRKTRRWTCDERRFLMKCIMNDSIAFFKKRYPDRSFSAINAQRFKLNMRVKRWWTPFQVRVLKKVYPKGGTLAFLDKCSVHPPSSVRDKAHDLGLNYFEAWNQQEIDCLRKVYPSGGSHGFREYFPNRGLKAVKSQAKNLGIHCHIGNSHPISRRNMSIGSKGKILTGKHIRNILRSNSFRPTRLEKGVRCLLDSKFNKLWQYVGDGRVVINGKCPDFIHSTERIVLLVNGSYWHLQRKGVKTVEIAEKMESKAYLEAGYKVIFIWDFEMKNSSKIIKKIFFVLKDSRLSRTNSPPTQCFPASSPMNTVCANEPMFPPAKEFPVGKRVTADVCFPSHVDGFKEQGVD